eukprot:1164119-Pyramimonas_sp.AAC.2
MRESVLDPPTRKVKKARPCRPSRGIPDILERTTAKGKEMKATSWTMGNHFSDSSGKKHTSAVFVTLLRPFVVGIVGTMTSERCAT